MNDLRLGTRVRYTEESVQSCLEDGVDISNRTGTIVKIENTRYTVRWDEWGTCWEIAEVLRRM